MPGNAQLQLDREATCRRSAPGTETEKAVKGRHHRPSERRLDFRTPAVHRHIQRAEGETGKKERNRQQRDRRRYSDKREGENRCDSRGLGDSRRPLFVDEHTGNRKGGKRSERQHQQQHAEPTFAQAGRRLDIRAAGRPETEMNRTSPGSIMSGQTFQRKTQQSDGSGDDGCQQGFGVTRSLQRGLIR